MAWAERIARNGDDPIHAVRDDRTRVEVIARKAARISRIAGEARRISAGGRCRVQAAAAAAAVRPKAAAREAQAALAVPEVRAAMIGAG